MKSRPPPSGNQNLLLAALPPRDYERIARSLKVVPLKLKDILHKPGEPIQHVYFPGGGFCSILTMLEDGGMVEVATIGREGVVGAFTEMDANPPTAVTMVQGETNICYRMLAEPFRREMNRRRALYKVVTRYGQALIGFIMQSAGCNAVHSVEQRLARWLLSAQDRMDGDSFPLTQEFAAMMLGATRPSVSVVAGALQKAGLIAYHRGQVTILDRKRLEAASCECYRRTTDMVTAVTNGSKSR
jgi:CRP-like cAMP-binding protein